MTDSYETVARRAAARLAAALDPALVAQTENALSDAGVFDDDEPLESFDVERAAVASLLVNAAKLGCDMLAKKMRAPAAEAGEAVETPREWLARRLRESIQTSVPAAKAAAVLDAVVEEIVAE